MKDKEIEGLKVYWFDTGDGDPEYIEYCCILRYIAKKENFQSSTISWNVK